jgi:hypothetical protein
LILKLGRGVAGRRENVDDIVGDVTIFVFCYRRVTANVSSAAAVTAVVKQPFRKIVRVVG